MWTTHPAEQTFSAAGGLLGVNLAGNSILAGWVMNGMVSQQGQSSGVSSEGIEKKKVQKRAVKGGLKTLSWSGPRRPNTLKDRKRAGLELQLY